MVWDDMNRLKKFYVCQNDEIQPQNQEARLIKANYKVLQFSECHNYGSEPFLQYKHA